MILETSHNLGLMERPAFCKPYRLTYELRPGYLYVHLQSNAISYEIARQYWDEIVVMVAMHPHRRILVDKAIVAELSVADAFLIVSEVASELKNVRLALCDRYATQAGLEFGNLVATNRGLNSRSFSDSDDAEQWLLAG